VLTTTYGFPPWPTIFLAMVMTGAAAYAIGIPTLKLEGHYLVMATLGFNVIISIVLIQLEPVTGGPSGFSASPPAGRRMGPQYGREDLLPPVGGLDRLSDPFLEFDPLQGGPGHGRAAPERGCRAVRGIDTEGYKVKIFVLSAVLASLSGSLYAHYITFISPGTFSFFYSSKWSPWCWWAGEARSGGRSSAHSSSPCCRKACMREGVQRPGLRAESSRWS